MSTGNTGEEKPLLDRAHRTLCSRAQDGEPPRPFVIRVHFFHVRSDILRKSGEASPLLYKKWLHAQIQGPGLSGRFHQQERESGCFTAWGGTDGWLAG